jgi:hypothetical protein
MICFTVQRSAEHDPLQVNEHSSLIHLRHLVGSQEIKIIIVYEKETAEVE